MPPHAPQQPAVAQHAMFMAQLQPLKPLQPHNEPVWCLLEPGWWPALTVDRTLAPPGVTPPPGAIAGVRLFGSAAFAWGHAIRPLLPPAPGPLAPLPHPELALQEAQQCITTRQLPDRMALARHQVMAAQRTASVGNVHPAVGTDGPSHMMVMQPSVVRQQQHMLNGHTQENGGVPTVHQQQAMAAMQPQSSMHQQQAMTGITPQSSIHQQQAMAAMQPQSSMHQQQAMAAFAPRSSIHQQQAMVSMQPRSSMHQQQAMAAFAPQPSMHQQQAMTGITPQPSMHQQHSMTGITPQPSMHQQPSIGLAPQPMPFKSLLSAPTAVTTGAKHDPRLLPKSPSKMDTPSTADVRSPFKVDTPSTAGVRGNPAPTRRTRRIKVQERMGLRAPQGSPYANSVCPNPNLIETLQVKMLSLETKAVGDTPVSKVLGLEDGPGLVGVL